MEKPAGVVEDAGASVQAPGGRLDGDACAEERLPAEITMVVRERVIGGLKHVSQSWNGVNIGDSLTDNRAIEDGYRFHDVFHLAYYALLGWSPVLRLLLSLKRKSQPAVEESQDGLRAVLIEEAVSVFVFTEARRLGLFEEAGALHPELLTTVRAMVEGYEVEARTKQEWEQSILQGYGVFRELRRRSGGVIVASLERGTLSYRPLDPP